MTAERVMSDCSFEGQVVCIAAKMVRMEVLWIDAHGVRVGTWVT